MSIIPFSAENQTGTREVQRGQKSVLKSLPDEPLESVSIKELREASFNIQQLPFLMNGARERLCHLLDCIDPSTKSFWREKGEGLELISNEWNRINEEIKTRSKLPRIIERLFEEVLADRNDIGIIFPGGYENALALILPREESDEGVLVAATKARHRAGDKLQYGMDYSLLEHGIASIGPIQVHRHTEEGLVLEASSVGEVPLVSKPPKLQADAGKQLSDTGDGLRISPGYLTNSGVDSASPGFFVYPTAHEAIYMAARHFTSHLDLDEKVTSRALGHPKIRARLITILTNWFDDLETCARMLPGELATATSWLEARQRLNAKNMDGQRSDELDSRLTDLVSAASASSSHSTSRSSQAPQLSMFSRTRRHRYS
ncbi:hypothetical protein NG895_28965 [Aeoliella sp. ICT_H6.2]|uniref:Uncharacterized protein n=1 Tax=Aeoliella straminimaris TaxID=2954799 RepID=A0A9X2JL32_9BACT|nr:hypothetical protein [Aeoliella straminimaris]MCO6047954.1 hypothetical protein [Aeoliella straminimaris]